MRLWVNGSIVDEREATVPALDHGLTVGDGVFETVKVTDGVPFALTRHLDRLAASAQGLGLAVPEPAVTRQAVDEVLAADPGPGVRRLRLTLTSGAGPLGSDRGDGPATLIAALSPPLAVASTVSVATVPWTRNEHGALAGLKTTSYAENVVAVARAREAGASEALLANTSGQLCEGTGSNVFVVVDGRALTPPLASGCLAGVTRALVLEWTEAEEADLPASVLTQADEVFLTSTTRDVQGVHAVDGSPLPAPGPVTARIAEIFAARAAECVDP